MAFGFGSKKPSGGTLLSKLDLLVPPDTLISPTVNALRRDLAMPQIDVGVPDVATLPPPAVPEVARPEPMVIETVAEDAFSEYSALAEQIGFSNPAIERVRMLNFLQREEIPVYDNGRVEEFMNSLVDKINGKKRKRDTGAWNPFYGGIVWVWKPLRAIDADAVSSGGYVDDGYFTARQYDRAVPIDVLKTVAKISTAFPEANFFVTDYATKTPDPFLCVRLPGRSEHFVVAVWDEPDFKLTRG